MNWLLLSGLLALAAISTAEQYTDRYDDINIEEILENKRLFVSYVKCVLDSGRCTPEGKELKEHIKDAMQTACAACTDKQRVYAKKVVKFIRDNEKTYWEQVKAKYDPGDQYKETYEAFLASED